MTAKNEQGTGEDRAAGLVVWSARPEATTAILEVLEDNLELSLLTALPAPGAVGSTDHLLLCDEPAAGLGRLMASGMPPETALAEWMEQTAEILALHRPNRRRVHLVEIRAALRDPTLLPAWPDAVPSPFATDDSKDPDPVLRLLARYCLEQDGRARPLAAEMTAAMAGAGPGDIDPASVFSTYRNICEQNGSAREDIARKEREIQLLKEQNRASHEEMELLQKKASAMREELALLERERDRLRHRIGSKDDVLTAAERQIDLLRRDLAGMVRTHKDLHERKERLAQLADMLDKRVRQMENSRSWRLTAPLRRFRHLLLPGRRRA